ncbi:hypothetical protein [Burkholderia pseudomallei]|nr:hypothetical protein [Burkholderia pseudomallei]
MKHVDFPSHCPWTSDMLAAGHTEQLGHLLANTIQKAPRSAGA